MRVRVRRAPALAAGLVLAAATPGSGLAQLHTLDAPLEPTAPPIGVTPTLSIKPDLAIQGIGVDGDCKVVITVVNRGPGIVPDSVWTERTPTSASVYLSVDGRRWGGRTIWSVDPSRDLKPSGGSATVTLNYVVDSTVEARATVDHTNEVEEADETNNALTRTLACGGDAPRAVLDGAEPLFGGGGGEAAEETSGGGFAGDTAGGAPAQPVPSASGSLLDAPLPPPPQDLPPAPQREDDPTIEPGEVVVASSNMAEAQALAQAARGLGFGIRRRSNLRGLGLVVTVLRVPGGMSVGGALEALRQAVPSAWADANHRYGLRAGGVRIYAPALIGWDAASPSCGRGVRLGILDTPVARDHLALAGREMATRSPLAAGIPRADPDHGTAIAALLVGNRLPSGFAGLVPAAKLYAAEIFRKNGDDRADTTAEWIVAGLDWLAVQKVDLVNLSLGGPRNLLLEAAIARLLELDIAVVAAGGNGGPDAPPVYPAAQPGVVAVTAVDAKLKPYKKASRGDYLAFAAPGVDVWSAAPEGKGAYYSGTSYAAPFVTAALAALRQSQPEAAWEKLIRKARAGARDLGARGKDPVYGWGLVQASGCRKAGG